ncbi:MAG: protein kinase [Planctomycetes bacterium]|nr:protein kinase [Planctomycetota bacterium]
MVVVCPHCGHRSKLREAKPGNYKPKCSKCQQRFELEVSHDGSAEPIVRLPPSDQPLAVQSQPTVEKTVTNLDATVVSTGELASVDSFSEQPTVGDALPKGEPTGNEATAFEETVPAHRSMAPERLGGYRIVQELGRGAMGAVYLAKQLSLDRLVALKVIQQRFATDPTFLARFTREAYAAAQLTHHNVVQIYDLGTDGQTNFFSMEYVRGQSLAELSEDQGPMDPKVAVGYLLQATRGLEFAHNHGMVHRDVKPANLMLNEQGVVKVADLGLVKTPDLDSEQLDLADLDAPDASSLAASRSNVTMRNAVIGTPNYMAPEQAKNASKVDHRADIYSLGCTLYSLLTGRPPFAGDTVMEVISKHRVEAMVRPELVVDKVPAELSDIVMRMVAKSPDERYASAGELVADLEQFLGMGQGGFKPTEQQVVALETSIAQFNGSLAARARGLGALAFVAICLLLSIASLPFSLAAAVGFSALLVSTINSYFVTSGSRQQTYLFEKIRQFAFQSSWSDRLTGVFSVLLVAAILFVLGWLWICGTAIIIGIVVGILFHLVVDQKVTTERNVAIEPVETLLKKLRVEGVDELSLREFVARFSGDSWEEYFESLFGFEEKLEARMFRQQEGIRVGKRFRAWREPLLNRLDARLKSHQSKIAREHLAQVEQEGLQAQGVSAAEAQAQARRLAAAMVEQSAASAHIRPEERGSDPVVAAAAKRARIKAMLAEARGGKEPSRILLRDTINGWLNYFFGPRVRFLLGACLTIGCVLWMQQNDVVSGIQLRDAAAQALENRQLDDLGEVKLDVQQTVALKIPIIGRFFNSLNAGLAGGLLLASALFRGWRMTLFLFPAATTAMFGPALGVPGIAALGGAHATSASLAVVLALVGFIFGRSSSD